MEALAAISEGKTVSNTAARRLAKLGWVHYRDRKVYENGQVRHIPKVEINSAGRAALAASRSSQ